MLRTIGRREDRLRRAAVPRKMTPTRRRLSVLAVALLFILASMGLHAAPASAADWRTIGPFLTRSDCNETRSDYLRYYDRVSICLYGQWFGFYFNYDYES